MCYRPPFNPSSERLNKANKKNQEELQDTVPNNGTDRLAAFCKEHHPRVDLKHEAACEAARTRTLGGFAGGYGSKAGY